MKADQNTSLSVRRVVDAGAGRTSGSATSPLRWARSFFGDVVELGRYRYALKFLVRSGLVARYQRSVLGFVWTLLHPLLMMTVLAAVFSTLMNRPLRSYTVFLFAGLTSWQFFTSTVTQAASSLVRNERLIRKIYVPKLLFPVSGLANSTINLLLSMAALFALLHLIGARLVPQIVVLPAAIVLLAGFSLGLGLLLMVFQTYFRDVQHLLDVVFRAWYFGSPILYEVRMFGDRNQWLAVAMGVNPMTHFLTLFHCAFCSSGENWPRWPAGSTWLAAGAYSAGALLVGYLVYKRYEHKLIFRL